MDYYIAKKGDEYCLPIFGTTEVPSNRYNVVQEESFTTVGDSSWTCPEGVTKVRIIMSGGGGGGGGGYDFNSQSSGQVGQNGTNGQFISQIIDVTPSNTYSITVGAGGSAGVTLHNTSGAIGSGTNGGNGGNSSFGSYTANGGTGGLAGAGGDDGGDGN